MAAAAEPAPGLPPQQHDAPTQQDQPAGGGQGNAEPLRTANIWLDRYHMFLHPDTKQPVFWDAGTQTWWSGHPPGYVAPPSADDGAAAAYPGQGSGALAGQQFVANGGAGGNHEDPGSGPHSPSLPEGAAANLNSQEPGNPQSPHGGPATGPGASLEGGEDPSDSGVPGQQPEAAAGADPHGSRGVEGSTAGTAVVADGDAQQGALGSAAAVPAGSASGESPEGASVHVELAPPRPAAPPSPLGSLTAEEVEQMWVRGWAWAWEAGGAASVHWSLNNDFGCGG